MHSLTLSTDWCSEGRININKLRVLTCSFKSLISAIEAKAGKCSCVSKGSGSSRINCFNRTATSAGLRPSNENVPELKDTSISSCKSYTIHVIHVYIHVRVYMYIYAN